MRTVFSPSWPARMAATYPPVPLPMTATSYLTVGMGPGTPVGERGRYQTLRERSIAPGPVDGIGSPGPGGHHSQARTGGSLKVALKLLVVALAFFVFVLALETIKTSARGIAPILHLVHVEGVLKLF